MYCILNGHRYENEIQTITQVFFPNEKFIVLDAVSPTGITTVSEIIGRLCYSRLYVDGILTVSYDMVIETDRESERKRIIKLCMFYALRAKTGFSPPWGAMTGIRPSKVARLLLDEGKSREEAAQTIHEIYKASPDKIDLAIDVAEAESSLFIKHPTMNSASAASLYVGIPFCPTRCLYCSFTSYPLNQYHGLIDSYLQCLVKEMEALRDFFVQKKLLAVYVGGGTPTSLDEGQLAFLLRKLHDIFPINAHTEFTVEAGRPDTLNNAKLRILKEHQVSRISINPQTMNNKTLERIGRQHTVDMFEKSFYLAREVGHDNINTDLILGLPGETGEDIAHTMTELTRLTPENVTVHTLAIKRASRLKESLAAYSLAESGEIENMLQLSRAGCEVMGLHPYYMYRQKNMLGNYENVGYSVAGKECLYNVAMMEETQPVAAIGAGAVTKLVYRDGNRIERLFNVKNLEEYIKRIDEMIERKSRLLDALS